MKLTQAIKSLKAGQCIIVNNMQEQEKVLHAFDESGFTLRYGELVSEFVLRNDLPFPYIIGKSLHDENVLFWDWPQAYILDCRIKGIGFSIYTIHYFEQ